MRSSRRHLISSLLLPQLNPASLNPEPDRHIVPVRYSSACYSNLRLALQPDIPIRNTSLKLFRVSTNPAGPDADDAGITGLDGRHLLVGVHLDLLPEVKP